MAAPSEMATPLLSVIRRYLGKRFVGCGDSFLSQLSVCFVVPQVKNNTKERAKHGIYQKARQ